MTTYLTVSRLSVSVSSIRQRIFRRIFASSPRRVQEQAASERRQQTVNVLRVGVCVRACVRACVRECANDELIRLSAFFIFTRLSCGSGAVYA
jgi:hypothetical protein